MKIFHKKPLTSLLNKKLQPVFKIMALEIWVVCFFGMNMAQNVTQTGEIKSNQPTMSFDEQIETLKKLKELVDMGVLSQDEFDKKKKEIMGL